MPVVSYVREHERFIEYAADERLTVAEMALWEALFHIFNARATGNVWPDGFIRITNKRVLTYCPVKFDTMAAARNRLKQRGLIDFIPGDINHSPLYRMIYFFPAESSDYSKNWDSLGDRSGDRTGDRLGERPGDRLGDNIIDYTIDEDKPEPSEEDNSTTEDTRARARRYPKRERQLNVMEGALYNSLQVWIARTDKIKTMYGSAGMEIIYELLDSDRFPLELVGYAIEKTVARNAMYETPLGYAAAYTEKLLFDWDERGFRTMEDVKRAKDDYT